MHPNPSAKGRWPPSRHADASGTQGYNTHSADRNDSSARNTHGGLFGVNQPLNPEGVRGNNGAPVRNPQGPMRSRFPDSHSTTSVSGATMTNKTPSFQHGLPAPRHASGNTAATDSGIALPPPRSAQIMAANGPAAGYGAAPFTTRATAPVHPPLTATRWSTVATAPASHPQTHPTAPSPAGGATAGGSLFTRLTDFALPKAAVYETGAGALSYAVSDGDGTRGVKAGNAVAPTAVSPTNLNTVGTAVPRSGNLSDISSLLQQVGDSNESLVETHNAPFTDPTFAVEPRYDGAIRREPAPSAFTFTTSSDFSTSHYLGGASGGGALTPLSTVPNAFSTRPDASSTGSFHTPFSTGAAGPTNTSLFSLLVGPGDDQQLSRGGGGGGFSQRTAVVASTPAFATGPSSMLPPSHSGQPLFPTVASQLSEGGESSEAEGLLDFRAVLGSPSAEPEDPPVTAMLAPSVDHAPPHIDPQAGVAATSKPTMAEALFKHSTHPPNGLPQAVATASTVAAAGRSEPPRISHPASTATGTSTNPSTKPNTPSMRPAHAIHSQRPDHQERLVVPAPRSAERTGVTSASRSSARDDGSFASRNSALLQSPHVTTGGATRPQRLPLESPVVTRHNIARLFRDSPQSQRHREAMEQNRPKPSALHRQRQWPPTTPAEVEALLRSANAGKLLRHLAIICFSRQNVKGVQELFDTWTHNGIPAPDLGFGAYYYYVKERSEKLLCMKHNGRGATPGHGYGKCDFESRRPNSTCRYEHVCLFCRSREHGWFEESRCEGYQQLVAEVVRLGVSEEDLEVMLDAMEKPLAKQTSWTRRA